MRSIKPSLEMMIWRKAKVSGTQLGKSKGEPPNMERSVRRTRKVDYSTGHLPRTKPNHLYIENGKPIPLSYLQSTLGLVKR